MPHCTWCVYEQCFPQSGIPEWLNLPWPQSKWWSWGQKLVLPFLIQFRLRASLHLMSTSAVRAAATGDPRSLVNLLFVSNTSRSTGSFLFFHGEHTVSLTLSKRTLLLLEQPRLVSPLRLCLKHGSGRNENCESVPPNFCSFQFGRKIQPNAWLLLPRRLESTSPPPHPHPTFVFRTSIYLYSSTC